MGGHGRRYRYAKSYRESIELTDGRRAHLRLVRPSDKQLLLDAFERLSHSSRYGRFMGAKAKLTEEELRYLTEMDGTNHFAIGAVRRSWWSRDEGMGIARFVRLADQYDIAEPAITVVDDYHGKGLGSMLLRRLTEAAWERDIRWFHVELLAENTASKRLFAALSPEAKFKHSGAGSMVATLPLPEPSTASNEPKRSAGSALDALVSSMGRASASMVPHTTRPSQPPP